MKLLERPDSNHRTQDQWIVFFNERKQPMISFPNIFQLVREKSQETEKVRQDCKDYWLVTSTTIDYSKLEIIHNRNSQAVKEKRIKLKEIPDWTSEPLPKLLDTDAGIAFCRALIDKPKATRQQITDFFVALSNKEASKIRFYTASERSRQSRPLRSVDLGFGLGGFVVDGDGWVDGGSGLSRGVSVASADAKQTRFVSKRAIFDLEEKTITIPMQRKLRKLIEGKLFKRKKVKIAWKLKTKVT